MIGNYSLLIETATTAEKQTSLDNNCFNSLQE